MGKEKIFSENIVEYINYRDENKDFEDIISINVSQILKKIYGSAYRKLKKATTMIEDPYKKKGTYIHKELEFDNNVILKCYLEYQGNIVALYGTPDKITIDIERNRIYVEELKVTYKYYKKKYKDLLISYGKDQLNLYLGILKYTTDSKYKDLLETYKYNTLGRLWFFYKDIEKLEMYSRYIQFCNSRFIKLIKKYLETIF